MSEEAIYKTIGYPLAVRAGSNEPGDLFVQCAEGITSPTRVYDVLSSRITAGVYRRLSGANSGLVFSHVVAVEPAGNITGLRPSQFVGERLEMIRFTREGTLLERRPMSGVAFGVAAGCDAAGRTMMLFHTSQNERLSLIAQRYVPGSGLEPPHDFQMDEAYVASVNASLSVASSGDAVALWLVKTGSPSLHSARFDARQAGWGAPSSIRGANPLWQLEYGGFAFGFHRSGEGMLRCLPIARQSASPARCSWSCSATRAELVSQGRP